MGDTSEEDDIESSTAVSASPTPCCSKNSSDIQPSDIVKFAYTEFSLTQSNKWKARCSTCKEWITETRGTTTSFSRHLKRKHDKVLQSYFKHRTSSTSPGQPTIDGFMSMPNKYSANHPTQIRITQLLLLNLIVKGSLPLGIVEADWFKEFMYAICPKYVLPSRSHLSTKLLPQLREMTEGKVEALISNADHLSMTMDIWTDRRMHSYLAMTGHTFSDLQCQSFLLNFESFRGSHTGQHIAEAIERCVEKYDLKSKMKYVITDNASNMKKAFTVLADLATDGDITMTACTDDDDLWNDIDSLDLEDICRGQQRFERLSCFAHTLQLVVKDGLNAATAARPVMAKCCKMANLTHQSAMFRTAFETEFGSGSSIPAANVTRWSSLFMQLSAVSSLDASKLVDVLQKTDHSNLILTVKERASLEELVEILEPFAEVTDLTQGDKYITIGCVVPSILALLKYLNNLSGRARYHMVVIRSLIESIHKRFSGLLQTLQIIPSSTESNLPFEHMLYPAAAVMNPAYRFVWLEKDHPGSPEVKDNLKEVVIDYIVQEAEKINAVNPQALKVESTSVPSEAASSSAKRPRSSLFQSYTIEEKPSETQSVTPVRCMLMSYLDAANSSPNATVKSLLSDGKFNSLSKFASFLCCIPATSAPVERIFSHGGIFLRPQRARMSDSTLCDLVFCKCNSHLLD